ncbi:MAG: hypothetical protein BHW64_04910 [Candidatus Melainabacteria bacterium LEY3_CP_29_8]|nr:MAG: hypothetical protein BHW64_04910 [Candidatus Melainabacteria bacterium LEY3_CP_29_8]
MIEIIGKCSPIHGNKDAVFIRAELLNDTNSEKAYLVRTDDGDIWIPKSQSMPPISESRKMAVTKWYYENVLAKKSKKRNHGNKTK